jgi:iron complex transport system substrate-binding protein
LKAAVAAAAPVVWRAAGPAPAAAVAVAHRQGLTEVPAAPRTVVVFDLPALDILDALGVPVAGVPRGPKPSYLAAYDGAAYAKVGTLFEPDYEAVNALAPDLIVVGGRSAPKQTALSAIAPTIDLTYDPADETAGTEANADVLARLFDRQEDLATLLDALDRKRQAVRRATRTAGSGMVVLTTGGRMSTYGPGSRFDILFSDFGIRPALGGPALGPHGQAVSYEFILETDPDWLFVLDRDAAVGRAGEAARVMLDNAIVHRAKAWRTGQVIYLDAAAWYLSGGGLTALGKNMDDILGAMGSSSGGG